MWRANGTRELSHPFPARHVRRGLLCALVAACSGTTGSAGPAGATGATGPSGPSTTGSALNVSTATAITGTITSVTISGPPVVKFQLTDQNGAPLQGLPAADLSFTIAQLVPGQNGTSSQWNSYIYSTVTPAGLPGRRSACDTAPKTQPRWKAPRAARSSTTATAPISTRSRPTSRRCRTSSITRALTHRVGFEIRNLAQANNAPYTFQPSTGATTGIFMREIVETATCDNCHTMLTRTAAPESRCSTA
jgi:hypothetical protein